MRKFDFVKRIAPEALVTWLAAETAVDIMFSEIANALARGEKATIRRFGTVAATNRAARMGRKSATAERIEILASKSVSFDAARTRWNTLS